jgi:hypothetical protein
MILLAMTLISYNHKAGHVRIKLIEWILLVSGSLVMIMAWTWDYSGYILEHYSFSEIWTIPKDDLYQTAMQYIPRKFSWGLFCFGEGIILSGIVIVFLRLRKTNLS